MREKKIKSSDGTERIIQERIPAILPPNNGDLEVYRPELLVTVPRVASILQRGIESEIFMKPKIELEKLLLIYEEILNQNNTKKSKATLIFQLAKQLPVVLNSQIVQFLFTWGYDFKKKAILKQNFVRWPLKYTDESKIKNDEAFTQGKPKFWVDIKEKFIYFLQSKVLPFATFGPRECPVWNALLFNKIRAKVGNNLIIFVNGGAPITV